MVTNQHIFDNRMNRRRLAKLTVGSLLIAGAATRPGRALATVENESTPSATPVEGATLTIYSGRSESLVGALIPKADLRLPAPPVLDETDVAFRPCLRARRWADRARTGTFL